MDEHPDPKWFDKAGKIALSHPEVPSIEKGRLRKPGFDIFMDFHLLAPPNSSIKEDIGYITKSKMTYMI